MKDYGVKRFELSEGVWKWKDLEVKGFESDEVWKWRDLEVKGFGSEGVRK